MSTVQIVTLEKVDRRQEVEAAMDDIFFEASGTQDFPSIEEKRSFRFRWLGAYVTHFASHGCVALDETGGVVGYHVGCFETALLRQHLSVAPDLDAFSDHWVHYPAHLHVNVRQSVRGNGVGAALVKHFMEDCVRNEICGVHVITGAAARNVVFYKRCGFSQVSIKDVDGKHLSLLGKAFC